MAGLNELREAISECIWENVKSYGVPGLCTSLALAPGTAGEAHGSKRVYVMSRLQGKTQAELVTIAERLLVEFDDTELRRVLQLFTSGGFAGSAKNLIFAANGPKPEIVLSDAVNNDIRIVRNGEYCLVYRESIPRDGLTWSMLVDWWARNFHDDPVLTPQKSLYNRLRLSLASPPEKLMFHSYYCLSRELPETRFPALIPQVYVHYDPYTGTGREPIRRFTVQRMDFLMLLPNHARIVIEIDGKQHYANGEIASPTRYAEMVRSDRDLRLRGYDVYRFGGVELVEEPPTVSRVVQDFFVALFGKYNVFGENEPSGLDRG